MATLPGLNKGVFKDPDPPLVDSLLSPQTIPNGTTLITTKPQNETVDNVNELIDYVSGDNGPNFIPQAAIDSLVADLAARELLANKVTTIGTPGNDTNYGTEKAIRDALNLKEDSLGFTPEDSANKGAVSGYAGLDASQELLLANFPSGIALQILRRNAANTALEFFTLSDLQGITSINGDTTAAQILAGTTNRISLVDAGDTHTFDIDAAYVGQASITTLGTITIGVWNGTAITGAFINAALADLSDVTAKTGSGTVVVMDTSPTIVTPTIASFVNANHNHQNAAGGGTLLSTSALSDTGDIAYLNTPNAYLAGNRQDFLGLLAGTAGLNVGGIAGNPTTQVDGDVWLNTATNQGFMRINGVDVDIGAGAGGEVFTWTDDHSMDTFKLIAAAGNDVILNAPTGQGVSIEVNGIQEYLFNATQADVGNKSIVDIKDLQFNGTAVVPSPTIQYISGVSNGISINVPTGDSIRLQVNGATSLTASSTAINLVGKTLMMSGGIIQLDGTTKTFRFIGTELQYDVATGETHTFRVDDTPVVSISATEVDFFQNLNINGNDILLGTGQLTVTSGTLGDILKHDATGFSRFALGTNPGQFLRVNAAGTDLEYTDDVFTINFVIDGGGSTITTGIKGTITVDFNCEVIEWAVTADQSGDIVVDVNRATFAGYPTTASIAGTELPTIITSTKGEDRTITIWSTIATGDVLEFEVDSITTLQRVTVSLVCRKTG